MAICANDTFLDLVDVDDFVVQVPAQCVVEADAVLVPFQGVQVELLDVAVLEKGGQADAVVGEVGFLADDGDVVVAGAGIEFEEFLTGLWMSG